MAVLFREDEIPTAKKGLRCTPSLVDRPYVISAFWLLPFACPPSMDVICLLIALPYCVAPLLSCFQRRPLVNVLALGLNDSGERGGRENDLPPLTAVLEAMRLARPEHQKVWRGRKVYRENSVACVR